MGYEDSSALIRYGNGWCPRMCDLTSVKRTEQTVAMDEQNL